MTKEALIEKAKEMIQAPSCCAELKEAGQKWLDAVGTADEKAAAEALAAELKDDVMPVDGVIGFFGSDAAAGIFGADNAKKMLAHAQEIKAAGAVYCDCPACAPGAVILQNLDAIL